MTTNITYSASVLSLLYLEFIYLAGSLAREKTQEIIECKHSIRARYTSLSFYHAHFSAFMYLANDRRKAFKRKKECKLLQNCPFNHVNYSPQILASKKIPLYSESDSEKLQNKLIETTTRLFNVIKQCCPK